MYLMALITLLLNAWFNAGNKWNKKRFIQKKSGF